MRLISLITAIILLSPALAGAAELDPAFRFRTKKTPHFYIHYHQGLPSQKKPTPR
jgi:hypothetical protein